MTVLEVIKKSASFLEQKGVDSPRLQVELMLAHLLSLKRMDLYLKFERVLTASELDRLRDLVKRRGLREPLQHILGSTSFCGLEIAVSRDALIPRPETELLAEAAWQFLNAQPEETSALDFGTGTGCIAIAVSAKSRARMTALDVSPDALALARANVARHAMESRIELREGDGFAALVDAARFDLIISNPPYIPSAEIAGLEPEVRDHDPRGALDGGADGLDYYRLLAVQAGKHLKKRGRILLELGHQQADPVKKLFAEQMWIVESIKPDYHGRQRILTAHREE